MRSDTTSLHVYASSFSAIVLIADAILGALSQPDIGQLFPDSDPKWRGQTSDVFVKEAVRDTSSTPSESPAYLCWSAPLPVLSFPPGQRQ